MTAAASSTVTTPDQPDHRLVRKQHRHRDGDGRGRCGLPDRYGHVLRVWSDRQSDCLYLCLVDAVRHRDAERDLQPVFAVDDDDGMAIVVANASDGHHNAEATRRSTKMRRRWSNTGDENTTTHGSTRRNKIRVVARGHQHGTWSGGGGHAARAPARRGITSSARRPHTANSSMRQQLTTSAAFTPTSTGYWCFAAVYSGDSNYTGSSDETVYECFDVTAGGSKLVTTVGPTPTIVLGNTNADGAVVTGNSAGGAPSGTVTFYECGPTSSPTACTTLTNQVGNPVGLTPGGETPRVHSRRIHADIYRLLVLRGGLFRRLELHRELGRDR